MWESFRLCPLLVFFRSCENLICQSTVRTTPNKLHWHRNATSPNLVEFVPRRCLIEIRWISYFRQLTAAQCICHRRIHFANYFLCVFVRYSSPLRSPPGGIDFFTLSWFRAFLHEIENFPNEQWATGKIRRKICDVKCLFFELDANNVHSTECFCFASISLSRSFSVGVPNFVFSHPTMTSLLAATPICKFECSWHDDYHNNATVCVLCMLNVDTTLRKHSEQRKIVLCAAEVLC